MKFRSMAAAAAALSLTAAPVMAQSAVADLGRSLAPISSESSMEGDSTILLILAVVALGVGIALAAGNNSDSPDSP